MFEEAGLTQLALQEALLSGSILPGNKSRHCMQIHTRISMLCLVNWLNCIQQGKLQQAERAGIGSVRHLKEISGLLPGA
jgi:hypothetical protein